METYHVPVMLDESIELLDIRPGGTYVDVTFGGGGHSRGILERLSDSGRLFAFDQDRDARRNLPDDPRLVFVESNFRFMRGWLRCHGVERVDGILADLGVSSHHFDTRERGFSFRFDAPLDMRMNRDDALTAYEIVNTWPREELRRILFEYGEERYAPLIAAAIERTRSEHPIKTTLELASVIRGAMPPQALREKQHPAKRSFQAIRIAVNDELGSVSKMMKAAIRRLNPNGRLAVITFHSLEDRIVKSEMQQAARGCTCPPEFPVCVCGKKPQIRLVTRKPIVSSAAELEENPRARSAKLRVAEKI